ncbi:MAG: hypothetical protein KDA22_14240, partial [Phycisphaerales bacterium]|nr:hypothetical protein [Phycisphaerales bacterium]
MAKLKLDDILRGLGDPDPSAPKEAEVRPAASAPAPASPAVSVTGVARQPAEEIPRPPDAAGTGLGKEVETDLGARDASPLRARPDDALSDVYTPEEQLQRGEPLDLLGTLQQKGVINPEQVATAERVQKQTPGRALSQILVEAGVDEAAVQQTVAELHGMPFERVSYEDPDAAYEPKSFKRLGSDFCLTNLVL